MGDAQLAHCIGVPTSLIAEYPPSAYSPEYQNWSGALTVDDQVTVLPSAQFGDVVAALSLRSGTNMHPLVQHLLNVARSRL